MQLEFSTIDAIFRGIGHVVFHRHRNWRQMKIVVMSEHAKFQIGQGYLLYRHNKCGSS